MTAASVGRAKKNPRLTRDLDGGSDGRRSRDLTIFSRTLYQLSYRASGANPRCGESLPSRKGFHSATLTGLEPATSAVTGRHANQLRYRALRIELWVVLW